MIKFPQTIFILQDTSPSTHSAMRKYQTWEIAKNEERIRTYHFHSQCEVPLSKVNMCKINPHIRHLDKNISTGSFLNLQGRMSSRDYINLEFCLDWVEVEKVNGPVWKDPLKCQIDLFLPKQHQHHLLHRDLHYAEREPDGVNSIGTSGNWKFNRGFYQNANRQNPKRKSEAYTEAHVHMAGTWWLFQKIVWHTKHTDDTSNTLFLLGLFISFNVQISKENT